MERAKSRLGTISLVCGILVLVIGGGILLDPDNRETGIILITIAAVFVAITEMLRRGSKKTDEKVP